MNPFHDLPEAVRALIPKIRPCDECDLPTLDRRSFVNLDEECQEILRDAGVLKRADGRYCLRCYAPIGKARQYARQQDPETYALRGGRWVQRGLIQVWEPCV